PGNHIDYYPIRDLSFLLDVQLFKNKPISFRTHEILLMFLLVISLYLILLELKVTKEAAFLIVSVWAINPAHCEMLIWITGRKDMLALVFGGVAVLFFLIGLRTKQNRYFVLAISSFVLSLFSKSTLTSLPLVGLLAS